MNNIEIILKKDLCVGCFNCVRVCPFGALSQQEKDFFQPRIDLNICKNCSKCLQVCPSFEKAENYAKEKPLDLFIGYCDDMELTKNSSSGGVASMIAKKIIEEGGCVYGASMVFENEKLACKHICINNLEDIKMIQGSKYVQSYTFDAVSDCIKRIKNGEKVAFFGTSCQIHGLIKTLKGIDCTNLLLVDLVCHGVPKNSLFIDYVTYLEKKYKGTVIDLSFRQKSKKNKEINNYVIKATISKSDKLINKSIPLRKSGYYRLFMSMAGYRPACYSCRYANIYKPSDITLGDFYRHEHKNIPLYQDTSLVMVNSLKGKRIIDNLPSLRLEQVTIDEVLKTHEQLVRPSLINKRGAKMMKIYYRNGFKGVQRYISFKNIVFFLPSLARNILVNCFKAIKR